MSSCYYILFSGCKLSIGSFCFILFGFTIYHSMWNLLIGGGGGGGGGGICIESKFRAN